MIRAQSRTASWIFLLAYILSELTEDSKSHADDTTRLYARHRCNLTGCVALNSCVNKHLSLEPIHEGVDSGHSLHFAYPHCWEPK